MKKKRSAKGIKLKLDLSDIENWNFSVPDNAIEAKAYGSTVDIEIDFDFVAYDIAKQCLEAMAASVYAKITADGIMLLGNKNCDSEADEETYNVLVPWEDIMSDYDFVGIEAALAKWLSHEKELVE